MLESILMSGPHFNKHSCTMLVKLTTGTYIFLPITELTNKDAMLALSKELLGFNLSCRNISNHHLMHSLNVAKLT